MSLTGSEKSGGGDNLSNNDEFTSEFLSIEVKSILYKKIYNDHLYEADKEINITIKLVDYVFESLRFHMGTKVDWLIFNNQPLLSLYCARAILESKKQKIEKYVDKFNFLYDIKLTPNFIKEVFNKMVLKNYSHRINFYEALISNVDERIEDYNNQFPSRPRDEDECDFVFRDDAIDEEEEQMQERVKQGIKNLSASFLLIIDHFIHNRNKLAEVAKSNFVQYAMNFNDLIWQVAHSK